MNEVFVFGSNREGRHGKGAALHARQHYGAVYGQPEGLQGQSYAIVTKELRKDYPPVTLDEVRSGIEKFLEFAKTMPDTHFIVTKIGCGLAGFEESDIRSMFTNVSNNVILPEDWRND